MFEATEAEILSHMKKIRKHLAKIEELMSGEDEKEEEAEKPWYPPKDPAFGPWIDFAGHECPIAKTSRCELLFREERKCESFQRACAAASSWDWDEEVVAYRIKK